MALLLTGCTSAWKADTFTLKDNPLFDMKLSTTDLLSYNLTITNKTEQEVEIIWDKTIYIDETNGTNGGFMFGNEVDWKDKDKDKIKSSTIIFAKESVTKKIYPRAIVNSCV